jgi:NADPH:quinone reductase-like Zn-dependent oxidoreductase
MKAIVQDTYGSTDVLALKEIDQPQIAADEVLVRVRAAGVDRGVWHLMTGLPYPIRLAGYGLRAPKTTTPGMDLAGVVEAVGADVTAFHPGDEVFGVGKGAFADYATAPASKLAPKPATLTFEQAAAIGISGLTALQGLRDSAGVRPGQHVLILGASGGVGSFAVQVAKAMGAEVTGVCSTAKVEMVRALGADHVIDYTREKIAPSGEQYDVILDIGGNRTLSELRSALTPTGTLVIVGGETGGRWLGGFDRSLRAPLVSRFVGQQLKALMCSENQADLIVLTDMIQAGQVKPVIDRTFPLAEAASAIRYMEEGCARGKVVITV